jgi:hypothetical protein
MVPLRNWLEIINAGQYPSLVWQANRISNHREAPNVANFEFRAMLRKNSRQMVNDHGRD